MSRRRKNKGVVVTIVSVVLVVLLVGAVAALSSGFQNMDVRSWVNGYEGVAKISSRGQVVNYVGVSDLQDADLKWTQEDKTTIKSPAKVVDDVLTSAALYTQDDEKVKIDGSVKVSATLSLAEKSAASDFVGFGFGPADSTASYEGAEWKFFGIQYDSVGKQIRFVMAQYGETFELSSEVSTWHDLEWYGIYNIEKVKLSFEYKYSEDEGYYEVNAYVNGKHCTPADTVAETDQTEEGGFISATLDEDPYVDHNLYATVMGTTATFKEIKIS